MPKKLEHEYVFNFYKENGYILKSIYNGMNYKDKLICPLGHEIEMKFRGFRIGRRCIKCSGSEKHSQEYVYNYYKKYNYEMKSIYINCETKDKLICPLGHEIEMTFNSFNKGNRCGVCFGTPKHTQEYVYNYYKKYNYILKNEYKGNKNHDQLICPAGHEIKIRFNNFQQGIRCKWCYYENNTGSNNPNWKDDRTRLRRVILLSFNARKLKLLKDDPLYEAYIKSQKEAKFLGNTHERTKYHIDHIFPKIAFIDNNLDKIYNTKIIKEICNSRENLKILTNYENNSKSSKYNRDEFMKWFNEKIKEVLK